MKQSCPFKNIVICDDHSISQLGIQHALQDYWPQEEFKFWKALTGAEAIKLVKEHAPDLITLDLSLPDMSGLDVLKAIRNLGLETKILILTNEENFSVFLQLLQYKANAILLKSYTISMLEDALRFLTESKSGKTYLDPTLKNRLETLLNKRQLSSREFEVLTLLFKGHTNKSIAEILGCSAETIKTHRANIREKTQARSRAEMNAWFQRGTLT